MEQTITRKYAIQNGLKHYFTGVACKRGHIANRLVSTCGCVQCSYFLQSTEKSKKQKQNHYIQNKEKYLQAAKNRYQENKETLVKKACAYQKNNLKKIIKQRKKRTELDEVYAIKERVRALIKESLRKMNYTKKSKTFQILGCTPKEFKKHIEKQFLNGMSWENRSSWHLDHIVPISVAKNEQEVIKLNDFTNLRPIWAKENISKSNKNIFLI